VPAPLLRYDPVLERDIARPSSSSSATHCPHPRLAARGLAILAIGRDQEVADWLAAQPGSADERGARRKTAPTGRDTCPPPRPRTQAEAAEALARTVTQPGRRQGPHAVDAARPYRGAPLWGWPMLLGVLYLVYLFVGDFGASTLVGLLEEDFFGEVLNPAVTDFVTLPHLHALAGRPARRRIRPVDHGHDLRAGADPAHRHHLLPRLRRAGGLGLFLAPVGDRQPHVRRSASTAARCCRWCSAWAA
jgi:Fe2+ transport system protein B